MLEILPFLTWLAAITPAVLLVALWNLGEVGPRSFVVFASWFLLAAYCQFFASSADVRAVGLLLQTILSICLLLRWRFNG